ncbi:MAG: hypothetical protein CMG62_08905 [Candidatus Marinimicrobia bacterium]|nr:hypothetical protein [Candidatus Neomarinimicrobiota bacterium]|tara:strand:+ start:1444 stop:2451 length:1008 start_codon:yes stop_codon:yes gene_type:complete
MKIKELGDRIVPILIENLGRQYPNKQGHVLLGPEDLQLPTERTPLFYGSYDWHSAVHSFASLVRLIRLAPTASWCDQALKFLDKSFTLESIEVECDHLNYPSSKNFEMPYGIAWLLILCRELRLYKGPLGEKWEKCFQNLEKISSERMINWISKLSHPIRSGVHSQTAFSMLLSLEWALTSESKLLKNSVHDTANKWYRKDTNAQINYEPSGFDFLSPILSEAALMARVFEPEEFSKWLKKFLPNIEKEIFQFTPVKPVDRSDGLLVHLDGLNLSRVWMLKIIMNALPEDSPCQISLKSVCENHQSASEGCLEKGNYSGTHWLGTFLIYSNSVEY